MEKDNKFWQYYNAWQNETKFLSTRQFDNKNFEALLNEVVLDELIDGALEILNERDDFIIHALDRRFEKEFGKPLIEYEGYIPLSDACDLWKKLLNFIKENNNNYKIVDKVFELSEEKPIFLS